MSRSPDIAFVVAVSAPVVTADVQMIFSSTNHLKANGYSEADIAQMVAARKAVDDYMRGKVSRAEAQAKPDGIKTKPWFKYPFMGRSEEGRAGKECVSTWRIWGTTAHIKKKTL